MANFVKCGACGLKFDCDCLGVGPVCACPACGSTVEAARPLQPRAKRHRSRVDRHSRRRRRRL